MKITLRRVIDPHMFAKLPIRWALYALCAVACIAGGFAFHETTYTTKTRIVLITDSHGIGQFGVTLASWLRARSNTYYEFFASGGSAPLQWRNGIFKSTCANSARSSDPDPLKKQCKTLMTPKLSDLLTRIGSPGASDPAPVAVIALGTNMSPWLTRVSDEIRWAMQLLGDVRKKKARCIWVGPPQMSRFTDIELDTRYSMIESAIAREAKASGGTPCELIDSRKISRYPKSIEDASKKPDGIHFDIPGVAYPEGLQAATDWANALILDLESKLSPRH